MTQPLPQTIIQAWGDNVANAFTEWMNAMVAEEAVGPSEFVRLERRLAVVESDVADIKSEVRAARHEMNERFDGQQRDLNARFDSLQGNFGARFDSLQASFDARFDGQQRDFNTRFDGLQRDFDARFDQINDRLTTQMRWSVGLLALFGTLVTLLLALGQYAP